MIEQQIQTFNGAYTRLVRELQKRGFIIRGVYPVNDRRYMILKGETENILIAFKREPFRNFGKILGDQGAKGMGDSINVEELKKAMCAMRKQQALTYSKRRWGL